jgi:hypothetical protein
MPKKISKNKNRVTITEYQVSEIDIDGEIENVSGSVETKDEAIELAKRIVGDDVLAVVVEKVVTRHPMHLYNDPQTYDVIFTIGDQQALLAGDWV